MGVNCKHTRENNMTSYSANNWVTFDDEKDGNLLIETTKNYFPWAMLETKSTRYTSFLSSSFFSLYSGSNCASISTSAASSRGISPILSWKAQQTKCLQTYKSLNSVLKKIFQNLAQGTLCSLA